MSGGAGLDYEGTIRSRADSRELMERVRRGQIVFHPPIQLNGRDVREVRAERAKPAQPRKPVKYVNRDDAALRPCLCCRQPFESAGPGNRMCPQCRTRDVSPYAL